MWKPKHVVFRPKDYRTPRSTQEIWGDYVYIYNKEELEPRNRKDVWTAIVAAVLVGLFFYLHLEGLLQ